MTEDNGLQDDSLPREDSNVGSKRTGQPNKLPRIDPAEEHK
jgi:hypothetical protein